MLHIATQLCQMSNIKIVKLRYFSPQTMVVALLLAVREYHSNRKQFRNQINCRSSHQRCIDNLHAKQNAIGTVNDIECSIDEDAMNQFGLQNKSTIRTLKYD
eukprot:714255_1